MFISVTTQIMEQFNTEIRIDLESQVGPTGVCITYVSVIQQNSEVKINI